MASSKKIRKARKRTLITSLSSARSFIQPMTTASRYAPIRIPAHNHASSARCESSAWRNRSNKYGTAPMAAVAKRPATATVAARPGHAARNPSQARSPRLPLMRLRSRR
ncbi:hypothetical protein EKN07_04285 [Actinobaculum sp. 352]|nr:hypothetical protein DDD63_00100 [Actinobaculum sp. 313]RTE49910.1 hypothetical protein EKN07_04285 [Actinobaculum sp. 352]